jgi:hypothetical protein
VFQEECARLLEKVIAVSAHYTNTNSGGKKREE